MPEPAINHEKHESHEKPDEFYFRSEVACKAKEAYQLESLSLIAAKSLFILSQTRGGFHHLEFPQKWRKNPEFWNNPHIFDYWWTGDLSTFDFSRLTRLVLLCHDHCVRMEIKPVNCLYLRLLFHPRTRGGGITEGHPTIEKAIETHLGRKVTIAEETY